MTVSRGWWCSSEDVNKDFQTLFLLSNVHIVFQLGNVNVASYKIDKIMFFYTWNCRHIENRINRVLSNHSVMQSSTRLKLRSSRTLNNKARVVCIIGQAFSRHTQLSQQKPIRVSLDIFRVPVQNCIMRKLLARMPLLNSQVILIAILSIYRWEQKAT